MVNLVMRHGSLNRIKQCSKKSVTISSLWAIVQDLVLCHWPYRAGFGSNLVCHGANQITIALDHTKRFKNLDSPFKVYGSNINSTNLGLFHQCVKSPISEEKKIGSDSDSQCRMSFKFEYLGNFETEFKNKIGYKPGA
jgi:hypothetical protein